ncbi:MAG TPA: hypothetical protein VIM94_02945 [Salegentibacter sp.]|uniref:hypothetical protein n=1 Tax=Salegentibacter sp. TaxID=1903072 RepID=UPI002F951782
MENFRKRPKGDFMIQADWDQLYLLTKHWESDLKFFRDDLQFLNKLLDKYFIWIDNDESINEVSKLRSELQNIRSRCEDLLDKTRKHREQLGVMIEKDSEDSRIFRLEHEHLENEVTDFVKSFRKNRMDIFKITEYLKDTEDFSGIN